MLVRSRRTLAVEMDRSLTLSSVECCKGLAVQGALLDSSAAASAAQTSASSSGLSLSSQLMIQMQAPATSTVATISATHCEGRSPTLRAVMYEQGDHAAAKHDPGADAGVLHYSLNCRNVFHISRFLTGCFVNQYSPIRSARTSGLFHAMMSGLGASWKRSQPDGSLGLAPIHYYEQRLRDSALCSLQCCHGRLSFSQTR